jgi:hypothetical protein
MFRRRAAPNTVNAGDRSNRQNAADKPGEQTMTFIETAKPTTR